nr:MAG TPA: hypothetical protein [Bacteriophage sp.]DAR48544.1 MAG TPA: hypothetical protein [Bacteriophage sp.]
MKMGTRAAAKFRVTTVGCRIIRSDNFDELVPLNTTKELYGDGKSRIFIY